MLENQEGCERESLKEDVSENAFEKEEEEGEWEGEIGRRGGCMIGM